VGAFRDEATARRSLAEVKGVDAWLLTTRDERGNWYLLLAGVWPDRTRAERAASRFLEDNPDGSTWIRRGKDVLSER
jgi:hypothetical protein